MEIKILVVEDEKNIRDMVRRFLEKQGYLVDACGSGNEAQELLFERKYQLVILDIMLPGTDGHSLLREIRAMDDTPVLMMTALGDDGNQIKAFENEADDYVIKPFSMQVLIKRVQALLRRSGVLKKEVRVGQLILYPETHSAQYAGEKIQLAPKEFEIIMLLAQNKNKIISHETLLVKIWGYDFEGNEGIVHANIGKIRGKLPVNIIKTVKGVGYSLEEQTENIGEGG